MTYFIEATGELEKAVEIYELWQQTYPRDYVAYVNSGLVYASLGNLDKALKNPVERCKWIPAMC